MLQSCLFSFQDASALARQIQSQHEAEKQAWQQEADSLLHQKQQQTQAQLSAALAAANDELSRYALSWCVHVCNMWMLILLLKYKMCSSSGSLVQLVGWSVS